MLLIFTAVSRETRRAVEKKNNQTKIKHKKNLTCL